MYGNHKKQGNYNNNLFFENAFINIRPFFLLLSLMLLFITCSSCTQWHKIYGFDDKKQMAELKAIPNLLNALQDNYWFTRKQAAIALGDLGPQAEEAIPTLIRALDDTNYEVRREAANAMEKIGSSSNELIPVLILTNRLESKSWSEALQAAKEIGDIGPKAKDAIPALVMILNNEHDNWSVHYPLTQIEAARTVAKIGPPSAGDAIPALINCLDYFSPGVREAAVIALRDVGKEAKMAVPAIANLVAKDKVAVVRMESAKTLGIIGPDADFGMPSLVNALNNDKNPYVCQEAALAMAKIDPASQLALDALARHLVDFAPIIRIAAAKALVTTGPHAKFAIAPLTYALDNDTDPIRIEDAKALGNIGPDAKWSRPVITKWFDGGDKNLRKEAVIAIGKIGPGEKGSGTDKAVMSLLKDSSPDVRLNAVNTLNTFAINKPEIIEALQKLADSDKNIDIKEAAASAVEKLNLLPQQ